MEPASFSSLSTATGPDPADPLAKGNGKGATVNGTGKGKNKGNGKGRGKGAGAGKGKSREHAKTSGEAGTVAANAREAAGKRERDAPKQLMEYCSSFRGTSSTPALASPSKKRQRAGAQGHNKAAKKQVQARPGIEIVNGQMVIRPLEIGGVASDEEDDREEVDEESGMTSTYSSFTNRTRTERWGIEETRRFYKVHTGGAREPRGGESSPPA